MKHFYNSMDVMQLLGLNSLRTARFRIQTMNEELKARGYWVERGKVPIKFFHEKYPFIEKQILKEASGS